LASTEESEEREVEEAEDRGESEGETVVKVTVCRNAGCCPGTVEVETEVIVGKIDYSSRDKGY
jgi:hypothetical protein